MCVVSDAHSIHAPAEIRLRHDRHCRNLNSSLFRCCHQIDCILPCFSAYHFLLLLYFFLTSLYSSTVSLLLFLSLTHSVVVVVVFSFFFNTQFIHLSPFCLWVRHTACVSCSVLVFSFGTFVHLAQPVNYILVSVLGLAHTQTTQIYTVSAKWTLTFPFGVQPIYYLQFTYSA